MTFLSSCPPSQLMLPTSLPCSEQKACSRTDASRQNGGRQRLTRSVNLFQALPGLDKDDHGLHRPSCSRMPMFGTGLPVASHCRLPRNFCPPWQPLLLHCIQRSAQIRSGGESSGSTVALTEPASAAKATHRHTPLEASGLARGYFQTIVPIRNERALPFFRRFEVLWSSCSQVKTSKIIGFCLIRCKSLCVSLLSRGVADATERPDE